MRTWTVGIIIGACILTSSCKEGGTIPGHQPSTNTPGVKIEPRSIWRDKSLAELCVSEDNLGKEMIDRCRESLEG